MSKINVAIVGVSGYTGEELVRILSNHPNVNIKYLTTRSLEKQKYTNLYPNLNKICKDIELINDDVEKISKEVDCIFLALPHGVSSTKINKNILNKTKIIDLSADFRLKNKEIFEKWYCKHENFDLLKNTVYGLTEIYRNDIKNTKLLSNPGCYPTCSILTLYPLIKNNLIEIDNIIIDAKSGVSGSGKNANNSTLFCEVNENIKAYKICEHRHIPEIEQELSIVGNKNIKVQFTPHLVPMNRGILTTCYVKMKKGVNLKIVKEAYEHQYKNEYFVRLLKDDIFPETKFVKGSNFIDINYKIDERTGNIICVGAIDNLIKGASGQAIQNMNLMFGFDEKTSLNYAGIF